MNPNGPCCPQLTNDEVLACTDPVVLDILAGIEVLGWRLMSKYDFGMELANEDGFHTEHYEALPGLADYDRGALVFAYEHLPGRWFDIAIDDHDPEQGLVWSPSRRSFDAHKLLDALEQGELELTVVARTRRPGMPSRYDVELVSQRERSIQLSETELELALCKACILFKRMIEADL